MVSIICPIFNEENFIERCIRSVLAQDFPKNKWELLLVDGLSTDTTRQLIAPYIDHYPNIHLLDNPYRTAPYAMNIGISYAKGEYICRIDAHSLFQPNYISTLIQYINELPNAANVGGICETLPANETSKAKAIAIACSYPLGVGNSTFRTATIKRPTEVDTVPFGFWRKSLFDEVGLFDEELTRNQDDEFNARTIQHGKKIYLVPGVRTSYFARDSIRNTWRMFYQYGLYKPLVNYKLKHPATLRQFIPLLFVLGLIIGLPLIFLHVVFMIIYILGISIYILSICCVGLKFRNAFLPLVFIVIHFSYGLGYLYGIHKLLWKRPFSVEISR